MKEEENNAESHIDIFQAILGVGPALFLENLVPPDQFHKFESFNHDNARSYLMLKLLTKVQQVGFVFERWKNFLENNIDEQNKNIKNQIYQTLIGYFGRHCATHFGDIVPVVSEVIVPV